MDLEFFPLRVADVEQLTDEAVAVTFEVPARLADTFRYKPGQHVTVRAFLDGHDVRRSYSICANAAKGDLRIGIKRLDGGAFSNWATTEVEAGHVLDVMAPIGDFTVDPDPQAARHYCAIAAGSGITPVLSLASTVLELEPQSRFTLIFGNRESRSVMFLDEVEGLKDVYPDRFHLIHVLSREHHSLPLFSGRIDAAKLDQLFNQLVAVPTVDEWYLCGPYGLVETARTTLVGRGVDPAHIHDELFFAGPPPDIPLPREEIEGMAIVTFTLEGRSSVVKVDPEGPPILDHALTVRRELPYSCRGGMCASCKARLIEGKVEMEQNWALTAADLDAGYVLTCQSHPLTESVVLDYDV